MKARVLFFLLIITFLRSSFISCIVAVDFDVRRHLSTATRYHEAKASVDKLLGQNDVLPPSECNPIHLNLVARHGTRAPTKKRIKQINHYAERIRILGASSLEAPLWMKDWESPWRGRTTGGEIIQKGEEEMFDLGKRVHARFPDLLKETYHPDLFVISTTQVPRSAASAVAFGMGLFSGKGTLGLGQHKAFSVISETRTHDRNLRFYEICQAYQEIKASAMPLVASMQENVHMQVALSIRERSKLNITKDDIPMLWFICKQEAAALDIVDQACSLFTKEEVELLEWADDIEVHRLKGYGEAINYRMGIPLLSNVVECMERAIANNQGTEAANGAERAHFRFAHAETLIPFTCLLGLFLDSEDLTKMKVEAQLDPLPSPPKSRKWFGSAVAPYGANTMVVLYKCSHSKAEVPENIDEFLVQVIHNERSVALPACNGTHFCPFKVFKEQVVKPHMKSTYESLCTRHTHDTTCSWRCQLGMMISKVFGFHFNESRDEL